MNILLDARLYGLENGGLGRYLINLIENLKRIDKKNNYFILLTRNYFEKLTFPSNWKKLKADFRHYSLKEQFLLPFLISKLHVDIVHFPHFNVPLLLRKKFIVTIHDLLMHDFKGKEQTTLPLFLYFIKRIGYFIVFRKAVKDSAKIIVPSKFVKNTLIQRYPFLKEEKITVVYEGCTILGKERERKKEKFKKPYLFYVGNLYPHKNIDILLDGLDILNKELRERVYLFLASPRSVFLQRLRKKIKEKNMKDLVKVLGFVKDEKLSYYYKNALAFVYPSLSEGFGLQGLEAMGQKTILLASDIPVFREIYKNNAIYFDPEDLSSLVKALKRVYFMKNKERIQRINRAYEFSKRYSWIKTAKETLKIYESCHRLRQGK